jgi:hypothetical protein
MIPVLRTHLSDKLEGAVVRHPDGGNWVLIVNPRLSDVRQAEVIRDLTAQAEAWPATT